MKSLSETSSESIAVSPRTQSVVMGRQDYLSVVLRLIGMELYKIRRRAMSKVLGILSIVGVLLVFLLFGLFTFFVEQAPASAFGPPTCSTTNNAPGCTTQTVSQTDLNQAKQGTIESTSQSLRLPDALNLSMAVILELGMIFIIILIGSIVGGEYSLGTVRLMFTRGPSRAQFLLSKIGAALTCIAISVFVLLILGILAGLAINPISGIAQTFTFFTIGWTGHVVLFVLLLILGLFMYAMLALFLATLGRTTAAGVAGGLVWALLEPVIGSILSGVGHAIGGKTGDVLAAIPDYFISNNIGALLQNQNHYIVGGDASSLSNLHALLVLVAYLVVFIGLSWWVTIRRDIN